MKHLLRSGATSVMPETIESSLLLGGVVLRALGEEEPQIDEVVERVKRASYLAAGHMAGGKTDIQGLVVR